MQPPSLPKPQTEIDLMEFMDSPETLPVCNGGYQSHVSTGVSKSSARSGSRPSAFRTGIQEGQDWPDEPFTLAVVAILPVEDRAIGLAPSLPLAPATKGFLQRVSDVFREPGPNTKRDSPRVRCEHIRIPTPTASHHRQVPRHSFHQHQAERLIRRDRWKNQEIGPSECFGFRPTD